MNLLQEYPHLKIIQVMAKRRKVSVYLVGGFLRDYVLKRECLDFDFAVEKNALKFAKTFSEKIKGAYVLLDEAHGCARVVKKSKGIIVTYDFADYRAKTFAGDLAHRDFTLNTLSVDITQLNDIDNIDHVLRDVKGGCKAIKAKRITQTSAKVFKEDPLRVLRAFSLKAMLGFTIDKQTLAQIKKDAELLRKVSYERIREELFKVLMSVNTAKVLKDMDRAGILTIIIPQIKVMKKCTQGGYHHLDVWPHSMETVNQFERLFDEDKCVVKGFNAELSEEIDEYFNTKVSGTHTRKSIVKLACLLHDIGKPDTKKIEDGRVSFHSHEHVGKNIVKAIARLIKLSTKERHMLEDMVLWHLRPGYLSNFKNPSKKAVYRYFRDTKDEAVSIAILSLADQRSTCGPLTSTKDQEHHQKICLKLVKEYFIKKKEKPFIPLLTGKDVVTQLKIKPSPHVGKILREVCEQQVLGEITTKQEALKFAKGVKTNY